MSACICAELSVVPMFALKRLISLLDSAICVSTVVRRRLISAAAARACGLLVAC